MLFTDYQCPYCREEAKTLRQNLIATYPKDVRPFDALGNILRGVPLDARMEYAGSFLTLLNPYALLVGILSLMLFVMHGAVYLTMKTDGELRRRMARTATRSWVVTVALSAAATAASVLVSPFLFQGMLASPLFWVLVALLLLAPHDVTRVAGPMPQFADPALIAPEIAAEPRV